MQDDLIFHITTRKQWKEFQEGGRYTPESLEKEGYIHASRGSQLEETANRFFSDRNKILLLVIEMSRLAPEVKYEAEPETGEKFPHIYGPLNIDAIVDKIDVYVEKDGRFKISFTSD